MTIQTTSPYTSINMVAVIFVFSKVMASHEKAL